MLNTTQMTLVNTARDLKAMKEAEDFINGHPGCTYQEATASIKGYFDPDQSDSSPWIVDWVLSCLDGFRFYSKSAGLE